MRYRLIKSSSDSDNRVFLEAVLLSLAALGAGVVSFLITWALVRMVF